MCVITFAGGFTDRPGSAQTQAGKNADTNNAPARVRRF